MNLYLASVLLGIVEGLTEFLPVSSTAHLRIAEALIGLPLDSEFWKLFSIFIQLGAILSVLVFYWKKILSFTKSFFHAGVDRKRHPVTMVMIAFLTTAIPGFLLHKLIGKNLEQLHVIALALGIGGIIMFAIDKLYQKPHTLALEQISPFQAFFIGAAQILSAVFPGTSRSMSTIAGGQIVGLSRSNALEFSFLLSIPIMFAATFYDLFKYLNEAKATGAAILLSSEQIQFLAIGFLISFVVAYGVIAWFLDYVRKHGFLPFALYRVALAVFVWFL